MSKRSIMTYGLVALAVTLVIMIGGGIANIIRGPIDDRSGSEIGRDMQQGLQVNPSGWATFSPKTGVKPAVVDENDDEATKKVKANFNKNYVSKPYFDCPDGRNDALTWRQQPQFVPCVNASNHLRLDLTTGKIVSNQSVGYDKADGNTPATKGWYISVRQEVVKQPNQAETFYRVSYRFDTDRHKVFQYYSSKDGGNTWYIREEKTLGEVRWTQHDSDFIDILALWIDSDRPLSTDVPTPFLWGNVKKTPSETKVD